MQFLTRSLYNRLQRAAQLEEPNCSALLEAEKQWHDAVTLKQDAIEECLVSLPPGVRSFVASEFLHDATIETIEQVGSNVTITLRRVFPRRLAALLYTVFFHGVRVAEGVSCLVGQIWLYQELAASVQANFELRVLLDKTECRIVADDIVFTQKELGPGNSGTAVAEFAKARWEQYQVQHNLTNYGGWLAGVDACSGEIWLGESVVSIDSQRNTSGSTGPVFLFRVGLRQGDRGH